MRISRSRPPARKTCARRGSAGWPWCSSISRCFPHMTVWENAAYGLKARNVDVEERREQALSALKSVGLDAWADSYPKNLSGGMQQRVGLARALAVSPEILLMDEPFSALDPLIRRDTQDELIEIQERLGTTIVFITHDLQEALKLGDQIAIMKQGRFVQVGTPQQIVMQPEPTSTSSSLPATWTAVGCSPLAVSATSQDTHGRRNARRSQPALRLGRKPQGHVRGG